jgi:hypothetical protein
MQKLDTSGPKSTDLPLGLLKNKIKLQSQRVGVGRTFQLRSRYEQTGPFGMRPQFGGPVAAQEA